MTMAASLDEDDILLATRLTEQGRWRESQAVCHRILNRTPDHPVAYHLLGVVAYQIDRAEIAADLFRRSVELRPHHEVFRNLGMALQKMGRHGEAVEAYRQSLVLEPSSAESLNALGHAHAESGEAEPAIECFERALALKPGLRAAIENLCLFRPTSDWTHLCDAGLAAPGMAPPDRYFLLVHRAIAAWSLGRYDDVAKSLGAAAPLRPPADVADRHAHNMRAFESFLARLAAYRSAKTAVFRSRAEKKIYAIGDSHILSYANTTLNLGGVPHRVCADWLLSDQAWKFAEGKPNRFVAAFKSITGALPRHSLVLCSFGEIDCRLADGIMKFAQTTGREPKTVVADEVRHYVASVVCMAKARDLQLFFLGTPAPHPAAAAAGDIRLSPRDRRLHATIVETFNRELRRAATAAGRAFVDLYGLTVGRDGFTHGRLHLDPIHLRPEALRRAPIFILGTRI